MLYTQMSSVLVTSALTKDVNKSLMEQAERIGLDIFEKWNEFKEPGLLDGRSGMVLLLAYLSKLFPEKGFADHTLDCLNDLHESLASDELSHHLSGGVAGIAFVFQHLRNIGVLDPTVDMNLSELDEFIGLGADQDFKTGNWDPLLGMPGLGIYFLERHKETGEKKYLEKIVDYLSNMRKTVDGHHVWITPGHKHYNSDTYNFGMAHGMPGVLSFLAQSYSIGIKQHEIEEMIISCLSFLLEHEYKDDPVHCFPAVINTIQTGKKENPLSRLGWCYGDLCMANTLIHCGKALHRNDWYEKGIEVTLKTTLQGFEESGCTDAPFCHGTVGLVHQYHRLYQLTQNRAFLNASQNWLDITQKHFYKPGEGAGGYYFRSYNEKTGIFELKPQYGLLEGSAGIALVYLSLLSGIQPDWDVIFLTNV